MGEKHDDLSNEMGTLSVMENICLENHGFDAELRTKLYKMKNEYETVFSWDIEILTEKSKNKNLISNFIVRIRERCESTIDNDDGVFNLNRFFYHLVITYELYMSDNYEESLLEIQSVIKSLETCTFDQPEKPYIYACHHISRATCAYIALTLDRDYEQMTMDIKSVNSLNQVEKAAIYAIKARIFMMYAPKGNNIALKFADQSRHHQSTETEWIIVWLKAKGRLRRCYNKTQMPGEDEIEAAGMLSLAQSKPWVLVQASKVYMEIAFIHSTNNNQEEYKIYNTISSNLIVKAIEVAKDDIRQLCLCLKTYIDYPKQFQSKIVVDTLIEKLTGKEYNQVYPILGKYYLKYKKDYEKAKIYFSRGMASGHFSSALQLVRVECLLEPVNKYPLIGILIMIYKVFQHPLRRLLILSQILIYCYYYEKNPKVMMRYLNLYMDQDIDDAFKKHCLTFAIPLFKLNGLFIKNQFLYYLSIKVKNITMLYEWSLEEKEIVYGVYYRFNKMSKQKIKMENEQYSQSPYE